MKKRIDTLVEDIHSVFTDPSHEISEYLLDQLGENVKEAVKTSIRRASKKRPPHLRMSVIGKKDRQLWYELTTQNSDIVAEAGEVDVYEPNPHKFIMFLYGDIVEQLLVYLIQEAGHTVSHNQEELEIGGVLGHCDPVIDGVPCDIKTASSYSFNSKFKMGGLLRGDDPFGYVGQLSGYRQVLLEKYPEEIEEDRVAWLAMNKENGEICLLKADSLDLINAESRIEHLKEILKKDEPPEEKCYPDEAPSKTDKTGNRVLNKNCAYCPFKFDCWSNANGGQGLRVFNYANGLKYFTHVAKIPPKVKEVT